MGRRLAALARARRSRTAGRVGRYTVGSVVAGVCSELVFLSVLYFQLAGPRVASLAAFVAGAVPNYVLNRRWAWARRGRVDLWREGVVYVAVILASALVAGSTTSWVDARVDALTTRHGLQVVLTGGAFLLTYGGLFALKYLIFDRYVFAGRPPAR